ncbi:zinc finger protein ZFP2-like [Mercenaria mercenaria]|uniref:zinc finger protein ZFP2-like n=1 Tax=Mercenaria mercenaria TaxID=6596 RepID=UPI00234E473C|nr:zinc finger protein ZFP2-like [Mercenaria mercenaria]
MEGGSKSNYRCGGCLFFCTTILDLHFHLTEHIEGGNYFYDNTLKTAYPKYSTTDTDCQTTELTPLLINNIKQEFTEPAESTETISTATQTEVFKLNIVKIAIENSEPDCNDNTSNRRCSLKFVKQSEDGTASSKESEGFEHFGNGTIQPMDNSNDLSNEEILDDPDISNEDSILYDEKIVKVEDFTGNTRLVSVRKRRHSNRDAYESGKQKLNIEKGTTKRIHKKSDVSSKSEATVKAEHASPSVRESVLPKEELGGSDDDIYRSFLENTNVQEKKCYLCTACNEQIKTRQAWENHIESLHYHTYPSQCDQCYFPFHEDDDIVLHNCTLVAVDSHECLQCPDKKIFKFRCNLLRHIEIDHENEFPLICDRCEVPLISELEKRKHMTKHDPSLLTCVYCQKQLKTVADLDSHLPNHTGETKFHCHLCQKKYRKKAYLRDHIFRTHSTDTKHCICEKCGSSFAHSKLLYDHRRSSCGEPIFECDLCDKKFCQKTSLKYHHRSHTGDRPFICDMCGDTFTHSHTLKNHVKHKHTNDRQFKCSMCDKAFVKICTLQRHERVHLKIRLHSCEYCKKEFSTNWNLKAHMRQHTGDTPYVCSVCGLGFAHNVVRKTHEAKCSGNNL